MNKTRKKGAISKEEFIQFLKDNKLSNRRAADALLISEISINNYRTGKSFIPAYVTVLMSAYKLGVKPIHEYT